jgi:hypothetical protein
VRVRFDPQRVTLVKPTGISKRLGSTGAVDTDTISELIVMRGTRPSGGGAAAVAGGAYAAVPPP